MKNASKHAKKLGTLLRKLPQGKPRKEPDANDAVGVLIYSFLLWESTSSKATSSFGKLQSSMEDYNDLRVSMPVEFMRVIDDTSSQAEDCARRICASLNSIYLREHDVTLEAVRQLKKVEIREYIESLDGMVAFVSARVLSRCFDIHSIPVDDQLLVLLEESDVVEPESDSGEVSRWLTRRIGSEEGLDVHNRFQSWVDSEARRISQNRLRRDKAAQKQRDQRIKQRRKERAVEAKQRKLEREEAARKRAAKAEAKANRESAVNRAASKKVAKKKVAKKKAVKKKVAKKKVAKKKVAKKKPAKKKAAKKKAAKKKATKKKAAKKKATKKKATKKKAARRKPAAKKKAKTRRKTRRR